VARDGEPREIMVSLGYSGWGAGQLEHELAQNAWLTVPASAHILFDTPCEERLPSAMEILGIDFANLAEQAGHA
jgi:putative transcriptional regulator